MHTQEAVLKSMKRQLAVNVNLYTNPEFVETNSAVILFTDNKAFKILKENEEGIDCSTTSKRRVLLVEEMEIGSEVSTGLYFGVMPVFLQEGGIVIGLGNSVAIEYALCMKRLGQNSLVYNMLADGIYSNGCSILIARKLAAFHASKLSRKLNEKDQRLVEEFGSIGSFKQVVQKDFAMFEELKINFIPTAITEYRYQEIKKYILRFFERERNLLSERIRIGYVFPVHGDFHSRNIFIESGVVYAIDRSLRRKKRVSDIVKDLTCLAVGLEMFGSNKQKEVFFREYHSNIEDPHFKQLLPFYMCHMAFVAGMVNFLKEDIEHIKAYFDIAYNYAINN